MAWEKSLLLGVLFNVVMLHSLTSADCPPVTSPTSVQPACQMDQDATTGILTVSIRVSRADCSPVAGANVATETRRGTAGRCNGQTDNDGRYTVSLSTAQGKWKVVYIVAILGNSRAATHLYVRKDGDKLVIRARDLGKHISSIESSANNQNGFNASLSIVLDDNSEDVEQVKRSWDDESMAWLKRSSQYDEELEMMKRGHRPWGSQKGKRGHRPWGSQKGKRLDSSDVQFQDSFEEDLPYPSINDNEEETEEEDNNEQQQAAEGKTVLRRRKRWDDDTMQWIKRGREMLREQRWHDNDMSWLKRSDERSGNLGRDKRKATQNTYGLRERLGIGRNRANRFR